MMMHSERRMSRMNNVDKNGTQHHTSLAVSNMVFHPEIFTHKIFLHTNVSTQFFYNEKPLHTHTNSCTVKLRARTHKYIHIYILQTDAFRLAPASVVPMIFTTTANFLLRLPSEHRQRGRITPHQIKDDLNESRFATSG